MFMWVSFLNIRVFFLYEKFRKILRIQVFKTINNLSYKRYVFRVYLLFKS